MQEDHVSMGFGAALKLRQALDNLARIIAVELLCASHALDLRAPLQPAPGTAVVLELLRSEIPGPGPDRQVAPMLAAAEAMLRDGRVVTVVEECLGRLD
jgi:histidine ammonia-lyase